MKLTQEGAQMLSTGVVLTAPADMVRGLRPSRIRRIASPDGHVRYEVSDFRYSSLGERISFTDPVQACRHFARTFGRVVLSRAVAHQRYAYLFPSGSSMSWGTSSTSSPAVVQHERAA